MTLSRSCGLSLVAALVLACSSDGAIGPPSRFDHVSATFACGPADGPALAIYFSEEPVTVGFPPGAFVVVYVQGTVDEIVGTMWPFSTGSTAAASFHPGGNDYEYATGGYLLVSSGSAGQTLEGTVDIEFPKAGHLQRAFRAEWVQSNIMCF